MVAHKHAPYNELRGVVGGAAPRRLLCPSEQMSFSTVKNIRPVGRRMYSATPRGRGCSKFDRRQEARRSGILAPDNPPLKTFLKKRKEACGTNVPLNWCGGVSSAGTSLATCHLILAICHPAAIFLAEMMLGSF
jgi:hypothetical protein